MKHVVAILLVGCLGGCSLFASMSTVPRKDRNYRTTAIIDTGLAIVGLAVCAGGATWDATRGPHGPGLDAWMVFCPIGGVIATTYGLSAWHGWSRAE